jgi:hypothetical protein
MKLPDSVSSASQPSAKHLFLKPHGTAATYYLQSKRLSLSDYHSKILGKETEEIQILLNGTTVTLTRSNENWTAKEEGLIHRDLAEATGKAIELRFRI